MKKRMALLLSLFCLLGVTTYSQKTELHVNAYSGLFFFRGSGSTSSATVFSNDTFIYSSDKPFGRKSAYAYAIELQLQRVSARKHLYGVGMSWEELKSETPVGYYTGGDLPNQGPRPATGPHRDKITIGTAFLNINPYIGQRFVAGRFIVDLQAGIDLSVCTKVQESAFRYAAADSKYVPYYQINRKKPFMDFGPRMQVNASYNRIGLIAGYSLGLTNFRGSQPATSNAACTNFLRFGLSYRIK